MPESMKPAFERSSHPFHMWDGITSTPQSLAAVLQDNALTAAEIAEQTYDKSVVHLLGCGSSYFSAIAGTYFFQSVAQMNAHAHQAWELSAYPVPHIGNSLFVAISHTGGTPVVLDCINYVAGQDVITVGLTDVEDSQLAKVADFILLGKEGREPAIPKTRSYVASLMKHFLLATEIGARKKLDVSAYKKALEASPKRAEAVIKKSNTLAQQLGASMKDISRVFVLGAGPNSATAFEAALKLQETVHITANGWQLEEGMHGPWVSMQEDDFVIVIAAKGPSLEKTKGFVSSIKEIGTKVWVITNDTGKIPGADYMTYLPEDAPEAITPLYAILPIYQFTYHLALAKGIHPDVMNLNDERYLKTRLSLPR